MIFLRNLISILLLLLILIFILRDVSQNVSHASYFSRTNSVLIRCVMITISDNKVILTVKITLVYLLGSATVILHILRLAVVSNHYHRLLIIMVVVLLILHHSVVSCCAQIVASRVHRGRLLIVIMIRICLMMHEVGEVKGCDRWLRAIIQALFR